MQERLDRPLLLLPVCVLRGMGAHLTLLQSWVTVRVGGSGTLVPLLPHSCVLEKGTVVAPALCPSEQQSSGPRESWEITLALFLIVGRKVWNEGHQCPEFTCRQLKLLRTGAYRAKKCFL